MKRPSQETQIRIGMFILLAVIIAISILIN